MKCCNAFQHFFCQISHYIKLWLNDLKNVVGLLHFLFFQGVTNYWSINFQFINELTTPRDDELRVICVDPGVPTLDQGVGNQVVAQLEFNHYYCRV